MGILVCDGVVKNLGVENMTVDGGNAQRLCIGGIAGSLGAGITIENSYVRGLNVTTQATQATSTTGLSESLQALPAILLLY